MNTKQMEKEKKDVKFHYKKVYEHTKILSEQTKIKLKNLHQEMETMEAVIKPLKNMTKTKIDNVINKELQMKQLQTSLEKEKRH